MTTENTEFAEGLRKVADFYEQHPEVVAPRISIDNFALSSKEEASAVARALGSCRKTYSDDMLTISRDFGPVEVRFYFTRSEVCTRKVVGIETVPAEFVPAYTRPARTRDIVEWECEPLLAANEPVGP
jgi:hypothetical protein